MKTVYGDIFQYLLPGNGICIPTNGVVRSNGHLVMEAGLAKEFNARFDLSSQLGKQVLLGGNHVYIAKVLQQDDGNVYLFSFPTKMDWRDWSDIGLIERSCHELNKLIEELDIQVYLPLPGCGLGGLDPSYVILVISHVLSDRVHLVLKKPV